MDMFRYFTKVNHTLKYKEILCKFPQILHTTFLNVSAKNRKDSNNIRCKLIKMKISYNLKNYCFRDQIKNILISDLKINTMNYI